MTIPVYRHNLDYDDWELASVYHSDDCDSMGRSFYEGSSQRTASLDDPGLYLQSPLHDGTRPRARYSVPQPPQPFQDYTPVGLVRPRWETGYAGKASGFSPSLAPIVPPPGVIFPAKDWVSPPQEMYWPSTTNQMAPVSDMPVDRGPLEPPPSSLLLSPSTPPPRVATPLMRRPSPGATVTHGQLSSNAGVPNVSIHASPIIPPARYHELGHAVSPRLAEAGCQAPPGMVMSPPRRSGYDVLPYPSGSGHPRGHPSSEEITLADGRCAGSGHTTYGAGDRPDLAHPPSASFPPLVPSGKYDHEHDCDHDAGRTRKTRSRVRERRPSIWQRFVRRFSPSRASVGQT